MAYEKDQVAGYIYRIHSILSYSYPGNHLQNPFGRSLHETRGNRKSPSDFPIDSKCIVHSNNNFILSAIVVNGKTNKASQ